MWSWELLLPTMGAFRPMPGVTLQGWQPLRPTMGALRPSTPGVCAGLAAPTPPDLGAPPQTPGDFRFTTKVTKGVPEPTVLDSL